MNNASSLSSAGITDGLIVVDSQIGGAGMVVLWRTSGDLSLDKLSAAWAVEGLDPALIVESETPAAALKQAVRSNVSRGMRNLLRPLADHKGWAYVKERATTDSVSHDAPSLIAKVNVAGQPVITSDDAHLVDAITASYFSNMDTVSSTKAGGWLSWLMKRCDAVSLKDTGGTYYVPPHMVALWKKMVNAIHASTSHRVTCLPAMRCEDTIAAVLDAITMEAESAVTKMQLAITSGNVGAKALEGKRVGTAKVDAMERKLARYEGIVGQRLDAIRDSLDGVRVTIAAAMLVAAPDMK